MTLPQLRTDLIVRRHLPGTRRRGMGNLPIDPGRAAPATPADCHAVRRFLTRIRHRHPRRHRRAGGSVRDLAPALVPPWLAEQLGRGMRQVLLSEKARSEFIVVPILLACQELSGRPPSPSIPAGGWTWTRSGAWSASAISSWPPPRPSRPAGTVADDRRGQEERGRKRPSGSAWPRWSRPGYSTSGAGRPLPEVFGCVTNGEAWQFLRLAGAAAAIDRRRYYIDNVGGILAVFRTIVARPRRGRQRRRRSPEAPGRRTDRRLCVAWEGVSRQGAASVPLVELHGPALAEPAVLGVRAAVQLVADREMCGVGQGRRSRRTPSAAVGSGWSRDRTWISPGATHPSAGRPTSPAAPRSPPRRIRG